MSRDLQHSGPLGDSPMTSYVTHLDLFQCFAAREMRDAIGWLGLRAGDSVLDAGCGSGISTALLAKRVLPAGMAIGVDISAGHIEHANDQFSRLEMPVSYVQADLLALPFASRTFNLIWCSNTINHVREPLNAIQTFSDLLVPSGRLALAQSAFLPDMFFAWDARLEREVTRACHQFYRDKYGLEEQDTVSVRNLLGLLTAAGLKRVTSRTTLIERTAPLTQEDETYFLEAVFRAHWGEKLRPYLTGPDWHEMESLCNPDSAEYCLRRPDFHHIQTFTVVTGSV